MGVLVLTISTTFSGLVFIAASTSADSVIGVASSTWMIVASSTLITVGDEEEEVVEMVVAVDAVEAVAKLACRAAAVCLALLSLPTGLVLLLLLLVFSAVSQHSVTVNVITSALTALRGCCC